MLRSIPAASVQEARNFPGPISSMLPRRPASASAGRQTRERNSVRRSGLGRRHQVAVGEDRLVVADPVGDLQRVVAGAGD
ncbi:hypothetical protein, partial [Catellatospora sp. NPDC049609]|uniref:hypothetical protein n=1 Tax=Catellatospora sp. NPDC049609 TaxID=3155505 RepID=UPI0034127277